MPQGGENKEEDRSRDGKGGEDNINVWELFAILREDGWKIILFSLAVGLATIIAMFLLPNIYLATAVITPAIEEKRPNPALGVLASFGVNIGSPTKVEDLETLFKSNDLTVRVFRKYGLWSVVLPERFDAATGKLKVCWTDRLFRGDKGPRAPVDWDAIRAAKDRLKVSVNSKANTLSVSFESPSAEGSARIVAYFLDEGKNRLQEEALDRAVNNKKFIEEQIGKTVDALTRDRFYSLYAQEVEQEMMARNREQFGFRIIDAPRIPDRIFKPQRALAAFLSGVLAFFTGWLLFFLRRNARRKEYQSVGM